MRMTTILERRRRVISCVAASLLFAVLTGCAARSTVDVGDLMRSLDFVLTSGSVRDRTGEWCDEAHPCVQAFTSDEVTLWKFGSTAQAEAFSFGLERGGEYAYLSDYVVAQYASDELSPYDRQMVEETLDGAHNSD